MDWIRFIENHEGSVFVPKMRHANGNRRKIEVPTTLEKWVSETEEKITERYLQKDRIAVLSAYR